MSEPLRSGVCQTEQPLHHRCHHRQGTPVRGNTCRGQGCHGNQTKRC